MEGMPAGAIAAQHALHSGGNCVRTIQALAGTGGKCLSRSVSSNNPETGDPLPEPLTRGHIIIRNLEPGRYAVTVSPPNTFVPRRCEFESRPLREEPCPFL